MESRIQGERPSMNERLFLYRGYEIILQPQRAVSAQHASSCLKAARFQCDIRIRKAGATSAPSTFTIDHCDHRAFADELMLW